MKPWDASDTPTQRASVRWLKNLARKLGVWFDGLRHSMPRSVEGTADLSKEGVSSPEVRGADGPTGTMPASDRVAVDSLPSWDLLQHQGPPEDWLALVREGAPGLLLGMDERRASDHEHETVEVDHSEMQGEESLSSSTDVSGARQLKSEPPIADQTPLQSRATRGQESDWAPPLIRRLISLATASVEGSEESPEKGMQPFAPTYDATRPLSVSSVAHNIVAPSTNPTGQSTDVQRTEADVSQINPTFSQSEPDRFATSPRIVQSEDDGANRRVQVDVEASAQVPASTPRIARPKDSDISPAITATKPSHANAIEPSSFQAPIKFRRDDLPHTPVTPSQARPSPQNSRTWPTLVTAARTPKQSATPNQTSRAPLHHALPINEPVHDPWPSNIDQSPTLDSDDRWPELPEASAPVFSTDMRQSIRRAEHLRTLDLEQRGGY